MGFDDARELLESDPVPAGIERRLLDADQAYDQGAAGRLRALDVYAEFSPWIDPSTPAGGARVRRILGDPRPLDQRFRALVALTSTVTSDEDLRLASLFAAVRWSLASDEYACADASLRRFANLCRRRGRDVPSDAYAATCESMTAQGRETEAFAAARALAGAALGDPLSRASLRAAEHRCAALASVEAWQELLHDLRAFEGLAIAASGPWGSFAGNLPAFLAARAHLELGDTDSARAALERIDASLLSRTEAPRFLCAARALAAEVELASGSPDDALAAARSVMHDGTASPGTWCAALTTALEAADRRGDDAEYREIAATLVELLAGSGDRIGSGAALRLLLRAFRLFERRASDEAAVATARTTAVEHLASRVAEIASCARHGEGLRHLPAADLRLLAAFRDRHARALAPVLRVADAALSDPHGPAHARVAREIDGLRCCDACLSLWGDRGPALPVAHLLSPTVRARVASAPCPACTA